MANGFQRARGLSDMYVYYQHLAKNKNQYYSTLHSKISNDLKNTSFSLGGTGEKNGQEIKETAEKLKAMAQTERKKEQGFINHTFGKNINLDIEDSQDFKNFVEVFNQTMQLEQVYEANKALILADTVSVKTDKKTGEVTQKKVVIKNGYTYFSEYFSRSFTHHSRLKKMAKKVADLIQNNPSSPLDEIVKKVVDQEIPLVVEATLTKLEKMGGLSKVKNIEGYTQEEDETVIKGYREIANAIDSMGKNAFGAMIVRELNLDTNINKVVESLRGMSPDNNSDQFNFKDFKAAMYKGTKYLRSEGKHILGGNMLELIENAVVNEVSKIKGKDFYAMHTGGTLAKPDNMIVSVGIDIGQMEQIWKQAFQDVEDKSVSRKRNIQAAKNLQATLDRLNTSGYILYSSAKNQSLHSSRFKSGGFNSGTALGVKELQDVMKEVPNGNGRGLARAVMQTLKGALGEGERDRIQTEIASYLAYFLFDDFETIGNEIANSSQNKVNCLHAMYLNGVYVPMSVLLNLLANAFSTQLTKNITQIAKVNIKKVKILYEYDKNPPKLAPGESSMKYWQEQRDAAQRDLTITVRFLKNFQQLMSSLKT